MLKANMRWRFVNADDEQVRTFSEKLNVSPLLARLLINRGIIDETTADKFLHMKDNQCLDPFLMDGMHETVEQIQKAINEDKKILVFGDYDADGVSATSLMVTGLRECGATVSYYVPDRFREGYGPNIQAIEKAAENGFDLIVTVDTGISAIEPAERAIELGMDYIITDHHEPPPKLPVAATSIVNPKKPGCTYPFKGLAGVGVAFKVIQALQGHPPVHLADLVALGTIADLVPLVDENRWLTKKGLEKINEHGRPGLSALLAVSGMADGRVIGEEDIGFALGPRINAAGRLEHAGSAIDLMLTNDSNKADELAKYLDQLNKERKKIVDHMTKDAIAMVEAMPMDQRNVLILAKEGWNPGVIGIAASRIVEKYYRPTIVFGIDPETGEAKGSARSIEGFDIFTALSKCRDILPHFGGHPMAAGMTTDKHHLYELTERLNAYGKEHLTEEMLKPVKRVECRCLPEDIDVQVLESINELAPFGTDNPKPRFAVEEVSYKQMKQIGKDKNHLKMVIAGSDSELDIIGFRYGHVVESIAPEARVSVMGQLNINEWNGFRKPQMILEDVSVKDWQLFDWRHKKDLSTSIESLTHDKVLAITFHSDTIKNLQLDQSNINIYSAESKDIPKLYNYHLVLTDLPHTMDDLETLFRVNGFPERIYAVFHMTDSDYFTGMPKRENFKWLYGLIKKYGQLPEESFVEKIVNFKGWSARTVQFMLQVFFDLDFVTIKNGFISANMSPEKKILEDSEHYQLMLEKIDMEEKLYYASYQSLKQCFDRFSRYRELVEEAVLS